MSASRAAAACRRPLSRIAMDYGLGWAVAGQALTPFEDIAPNPWGPMLEVRQTPVLGDRDADRHLGRCAGLPLRPVRFQDARRQQLGLLHARLHARRRWPISKRETGLQFAAAFEHEFLLCGGGLPTGCVPFSLEQMRDRAAFTARPHAGACIAADVGLETVEPEYGVLPVRSLLRAGDRRDGGRPRHHHPRGDPRGGAAPRLARQLHAEADAASVGNGAHVHFSFRRRQGRQPHLRCRRSRRRRRRSRSISSAGVVRTCRHSARCGAEPGLLSAPRPASLELRLCRVRRAEPRGDDPRLPVARARTEAAQQAFNLETARIPDATASPYMVIGALVRAGLEGIRAEAAAAAGPRSRSRRLCRRTRARAARHRRRCRPRSARRSIACWRADVAGQAGCRRPHARVLCGGEAQGDRDVRRQRRRKHMCKRYHDAY